MMLRAKLNVAIPSVTLAEVIRMSTNNRLAKLEQLFKEVEDPTVGHEVIGDTAVVYPSALGESLSPVYATLVRQHGPLRQGVSEVSVAGRTCRTGGL